MTRTAVFFFALVLWLFGMANAGEWHIEGNLRCDDCHIHHASGAGLSGVEVPYALLLRKMNINDLCLSCHDGSDASAPDVLAPVDMYSTTSARESAGGFLRPPAFEHLGGHDLGIMVPTPLQSAGNATELSCASCHDVHGNSNYRNLAADPARNGSNYVIQDGMQVFTDQKPARPPSTVGTIAAYQRDNVAYVSGVDDWCASCHDLVAVNSLASPPAHFGAHPSGVAMNQFSGNYHADPGHWIGGVGEGFALGGIDRIPFLAPSATTFLDARTPSISDQVACLSCHRAHGGNQIGNLRWPMAEGGENSLAGCQQCHNK